LNDITRQPSIPEEDRLVRARALIRALAATLLKPTGAQRNTQNPHIMDCEGVIAVSSNSLPAPTISPLVENYREQIQASSEACNRLEPGSTRVHRFGSMSEGVDLLATLAGELELPAAASRV
jgi:CRISPR-associated protein Cst2